MAIAAIFTTPVIFSRWIFGAAMLFNQVPGARSSTLAYGAGDKM
jgi:hypothetical protein